MRNYDSFHLQNDACPVPKKKAANPLNGLAALIFQITWIAVNAELGDKG
jgi:hypothetical protein